MQDQRLFAEALTAAKAIMPKLKNFVEKASRCIVDAHNSQTKLLQKHPVVLLVLH